MSSHQYQQSAKLNRIVQISAVISAILIFISPPLYYALNTYMNQKSILRTEAEINSRIVGQIISLNPEFWKFQTTRYTEVLEYRREDKTPENRIVYSLDGEVVAESRDGISPPFISEDFQLFDSGKVIGTIKIQRSARPFMVVFFVTSVLSFLASLAFYYFMKQLPLRALNETFQNLFEEQEKLRNIEKQLARANDILEQKVEEVTRELSEKSQALVTSAKMSALGEMASGIAHEINNPLAVIMGKAQLSQKMLTSANVQLEKVVDNQEMIIKVSKRIVKIINGLKSFARDSASDPMVMISIEQILDETLALCHERLIKENVSFRFENKVTDEYQMNGRPTQISQVILNLLSNSIDANEGKEKKWIKLSSEIIDHNMVIRVTDSGNGIPDEIVQKMMQPFFTTKDIGKGTGLGLSISKGIIESHNGKFYYDPACPNTSFVIELPLIAVSREVA